jgi:hypothetical protein
MSDGEDEAKATAPNHTVGYRRPPTQHRFKKGASGNPRGRPRKARPKPSGGSISVADLVIAEAYRPITIRENDEPVTLPMIQAVMRSLGVAAVKGNHRAQLALTGLVQAAEQRQLDDHRAIFESVLEYKIYWKDVFERCDSIGKPRPEPVPHPDDIVVNGRTGEVIFNGPFDDAEKAQWENLALRKADALEEIAYHRKQLKRSRGDPARHEKMIEVEQRLIDMVESVLPDEKTRRQPDFSIHQWRERQQKIREMKTKWRATSSPKSLT